MLASTGLFPEVAGSIAGSSEEGRKLETAVEGPLISNHQDVVIEGALQGLGILYAYDDDRLRGARARAAKAHPG